MKLTTGRRNVRLGHGRHPRRGTAVARICRRFVPPLPKSAVPINVIDIAGNLALTQPALEKYRREKSSLVSRITFTERRRRSCRQAQGATAAGAATSTWC